MPERIQLRRTKGWRKPPGSIVCSRPTRWGNHFVVERYRPWVPGEAWSVWSPVSHALRPPHPISVHVAKYEATVAAVALHRKLVLEPDGSGRSILVPSTDDIRTHLAGHDLGCWCRLDAPCHVDVLLEVANG